ncbi:hypothetical protein ACX9R5_04585 [Rathayibacter sp. CAU 1779]
MIRRWGTAVGRAARWVAGVVALVGGAQNGGRSGDESAARMYRQPQDEYRP